MPYTVIINPHIASKEEVQAAQQHFPTVSYPTQLKGGEQLIPRFSVLPNADYHYGMYKAGGQTCLNSREQHEYVASARWIPHFPGSTPTTYMQSGWATVPDCAQGWVVKGLTNSRKQRWDTHMRAPSRSALKEVMSRCYEDPLLSEQGLMIREYVPLAPYLEDGEPLVLLHGLPVVMEWRTFWLRDHLISSHFYWAPHTGTNPTIPEPLLQAAQAWAEQLSKDVNFFVLDVALTSEGQPLLIEVNDGQQSGLNGLDPQIFYQALKALLI